MSPKIIVNSPWYFFVLSLMLGLAVACWLYYRNPRNREVPPWVVFTLFGLRFLLTSLITLLLLNIMLRRLSTEKEDPLILLAIDNSSSMTAGNDSGWVRNDFLRSLNNLRNAVAGRYVVKTVLFGEQATTSDEHPLFSEKETDIENLLSEMDNSYANVNVGALIIASDGIYNKGANPIHRAQKLGFPIYTLAMGDTAEIRDVLVRKVNHNRVAYLGNNFPVEVVVNARKFEGKKVTVSLSQKGAPLATRDLFINNRTFLGTMGFTLNATTPGVVRYDVKVSVLEGENNVVNNSQSFVVEVIDNREKVLLLATAPHPDVSAIREAIVSATNYELDYALAEGLTKPLRSYNLVIVHGFTPGLQTVVNECLNAGIPLWLVNPLVATNLPGVNIASSNGRYNDAEPYLENDFGLFSISNELKGFIDDLPALKVFFGNYSLNNGAEILIAQRLGSLETNNPILQFTATDGLKNALFLGDGLWKWKLRDFAEHGNHNLFNELIAKSVQYLSVKSDKRFFRIHAPRVVSENENLVLDAEVYNKSYEPITEPDVTLTLTNSKGKQFNYTFSKAGENYRLNVGLIPPGEYTYKAQVKVGAELFTGQGMIGVREVVSEKINTVADHDLLFKLSNRTGGKMYNPRQMDQLRDDLLRDERIRSVTYSQNLTLPLIELKWLFFLIILFATTEWSLRKRYLSI